MKKKVRRLFCILLSVFLMQSFAVPAYALEPVNGWSTDNASYYVDSVAVSGFYQVDGKTYYFHPENEKKVTGFHKIDGEFYFFDDDGVMQTGWRTLNNHRYYFDTKTGKAKKGHATIGSSRYFFSFEGKMQTGWVTTNKKQYYFSPDKNSYGKGVTGIVTIKGEKYEFDKNGVMVKKIVPTPAKPKTTKKTAKPATNTNSMLVKANKYSSPTKYLILINKKKHRLVVYKGKKGAWKEVKNWSCTIGAKATPTPSGNFLMGSYKGKPFHQRYFDSGKVRCWYASRIVRGINIHSVLYTKNRRPTKIKNGRLGANLSHGCIRLQINNAKWIYKNIPSKTRCVIY